MTLTNTAIRTAPVPASKLATLLRERAKQTASTASTAITTLATDLAGQPWLDGYALGKGINAETGNLSLQAIEAFKVTPASTTSSKMTYSSIKTQSDVEQQIQASADGSYNMDGVTISASTSYLSEVKQSELSMTILATYEVWYNDYDAIDPTTVKLSKQAKDLVDAGKFDQFRQDYGDYYLAGSKRWAIFRAVFTMQADSESELTEFQAKIGATAPEIFTAEGASAFKSAVSSSKVSVNLVLDMQGYSGTPPQKTWTIDDLSTALNWFQANTKPIPVQAEMIHYSQIDDRIPVTLPIDPQVFSDVSQIYLSVFMINIAWNSLPSAWQSQYELQVVGLTKKVNASAASLVNDSTLRAALMPEVSSLLTSMTNMYQRVQFVRSIQALQVNEPAVSSSQSGTSTYGSINYPNAANDPDFAIRSNSRHVQEGYKIGHREADVDVSTSDVSAGLILQWQVQADWTDGTDGNWWKNKQNNNSPYVLLNTSANIHLKSEYDRGFDYTITIWYVDASLVPSLSSLDA